MNYTNIQKYFRTVNNLNDIIKSGQDKKECLKEALDLIMDVMEVERGAIFLLDGARLKLIAGLSRDHTAIRDAKRFSQTVVRTTIETKTTITSYNALEDPRFKDSDSVKVNKIHFVACVPLKTAERVTGTLYVDCPITKRLSEIEEGLLLWSADFLAGAIEKSWVRERLRDARPFESDKINEAITFLKPKSKIMQKVCEEIKKVAPTDCTVLLIGETGVGKDVLARFIHNQSKRREQKYIPFYCGAVPDTLFESELFGHKKGAFTGAGADKKGLFEEAEKGTIFFNEITDTSLAVQAKLLEAIEWKRIRRLGENREQLIDVRIICATNKDLEALVKKGAFRQDLYHRLSAVPIKIPPLRDRKEDIVLFADYFLNQYRKEFNKPGISFAPEVIETFLKYSWPGNIRELRNVVERAVLLANGERIFFNNIALSLDINEQKSKIKGLKEKMRGIEKNEIIQTLENNGGNIIKAAMALSISPRHLRRLMKQYGARGQVQISL